MRRTITLPANHVETLAGRGEAHEIDLLLTAAYWLRDRGDATALFLFRRAHDKLARLADAMGYTLTPKVAAANEVKE